MRRPLPKAACFALLAALVLAPPTSAGKAATKPAAVGDYSATLDSPPGDYVLGRFTVVKAKGGKRAIVPTKKLGGIFYPDANQCERLSAPLVSERIRVNRRGGFDVRERTQGGRGKLVVRWSGRWRTPRKVSGRIVIRHADCVSRLRWTGARVP